MKKFLILLMAFVAMCPSLRADEGMWLLSLMKQQHLADSLKRAGIKLKPEQVYSETGPSLRECVGIFGGGCTGEVVSADGLVLTNHHCGFQYVHDMSSMGNDIMKDGYFAHSRSEELRTPENLTFTFVLAVEDVTAEVEKQARQKGADAYDCQTGGFLAPIADSLLTVSRFKDMKGMRARLIPYFGGNQFYIFYEQTYGDVRLVANPPYNIGQFGGNSDNWMWPRHNADFAMFRIYADKDGQPAAYSPDNVPLHRDKYLPISLKGYKEGDFTMIMGFPGSTERYLTAAQVAYQMQNMNGPIAMAGNPLLALYKEVMDMSDENRLMLEDDYFSLANMIKNYSGAIESVEKTHLVDEKRAEEARFRDFIRRTGREAEYAGVIDSIAAYCESRAEDTYNFALYFITARQISSGAANGWCSEWKAAIADSAMTKADSIAAQAVAALATAQRQPTYAARFDFDRRQAQLLIPIMAKNLKGANKPAYCNLTGKQLDAYIDSMYTHSILTDSLRLAKALQTHQREVVANDPLLRFHMDNRQFRMEMASHMDEQVIRKATENVRKYTRGLCDMYNNTKAPDANFTLRMTYGHVTDLIPRDGVRYDWRTVLDGMFEKESKTNSDYFINERLRTLYRTGNYGRYARKDGKLQTCFLSNNDITGGNSGSPVMNAKGELIGLAFDGNSESLCSDLKFNAALQRCINVDIRFVLFIIDTYGGASYVLDELDLR